MVKSKRKKKRTHVTEDEDGPHTFVVNKGSLGKAGSELMLDVRKCLEPFTARNLRARKFNKIKDYIHVSAQYGVSHLLLLSTSMLGYINLRVCKVPRGPTLSFRISSYTLLKDVVSLLKRPKGYTKTYETAPLLIMNGFDESLPHHKLITTTFQNMLPAVNVKNVKLNTLKRCLLFNFNADMNTIDVRHFSISATPVGVNRAIKKLLKKVPDLSKYSDISDFLTNGYFSESDGEDAPDTQVVLPQKIAGRGNLKSNRSAIRLTELGPRLTLNLVKIQDGVGEGEVLHHSYITKTAEEKKQLRAKIEKQRQLKERRKKEQQKNVMQKKKNLEDEQKAKKRKSEEVVSSDDDVQYYQEEIGQTPDPELLLKTKRTKRSSDFKKSQKRPLNDVPVSSEKTEQFSQPKSKRTKRSSDYKKSKVASSVAKDLAMKSSDQKTLISNVKSDAKGIAFHRKKK